VVQVVENLPSESPDFKTPALSNFLFHVFSLNSAGDQTQGIAHIMQGFYNQATPTDFIFLWNQKMKGLQGWKCRSIVGYSLSTHEALDSIQSTRNKRKEKKMKGV
jgi:hypothetical protein